LQKNVRTDKLPVIYYKFKKICNKALALFFGEKIDNNLYLFYFFVKWYNIIAYKKFNTRYTGQRNWAIYAQK